MGEIAKIQTANVVLKAAALQVHKDSAKMNNLKELMALIKEESPETYQTDEEYIELRTKLKRELQTALAQNSGPSYHDRVDIIRLLKSHDISSQVPMVVLMLKLSVVVLMLKVLLVARMMVLSEHHQVPP